MNRWSRSVFAASGRLEPLALAAHALTRSVHHLAAGRFAPVDHRCDLGVTHVEHIVEEERSRVSSGASRSSSVRKAIDRSAERSSARSGGAALTIGSGSHGPTLPLALGLQSTQPIDRQPRGGRYEPRLCVINRLMCRLRASGRKPPGRHPPHRSASRASDTPDRRDGRAAARRLLWGSSIGSHPILRSKDGGEWLRM